MNEKYMNWVKTYTINQKLLILISFAHNKVSILVYINFSSLGLLKISLSILIFILFPSNGILSEVAGLTLKNTF